MIQRSYICIVINSHHKTEKMEFDEIVSEFKSQFAGVEESEVVPGIFRYKGILLPVLCFFNKFGLKRVKNCQLGAVYTVADKFELISIDVKNPNESDFSLVPNIRKSLQIF